MKLNQDDPRQFEGKWYSKDFQITEDEFKICQSTISSNVKEKYYQLSLILENINFGNFVSLGYLLQKEFKGY